MSAIETRELYESGELTIRGAMEEDDSEPDFPEFDDPAAEKAFEEHYHYGDFSYVGMVVTVEYAGAEISSDSLWGIEHGQVGTVGAGGFTGPGSPGDPVIADAWELISPQYETDKATGKHVVIMGSPLSGVLDEAINNARNWARSHGSEEMQAALTEAAKWADPHNPEGWAF